MENIFELGIDLDAYMEHYPTGAYVCFDSSSEEDFNDGILHKEGQYLDTLDEFKNFIESYKEGYTKDTKVRITFQLDDLKDSKLDELITGILNHLKGGE